MTIPTSFKLYGQTIQVKFAKDILGKDDLVGYAEFRTNTIYLAPSTDVYPRSQEQIEQTFCHELLHFILHFAGEDKLRKNEKFVDVLAYLLHQVLTTIEEEKNVR